MLCVATSWTRFIDGGDIISEDEKKFGIHGGELETSVMLSLAPEKVTMENAKNFHSQQRAYADSFTHLRAYGPHAFGWKIQDLNKEGVTGNAKTSTAQKGEQLIEVAVKGLGELLQDMHKFNPADLS